MTGDQLVPLVVIVVGVLALNLVAALLLARRNGDPTDLFGSAVSRSSGAVESVDSDAVGGASGADRSEGRRDPPPLDVDGETVVCRHCGAENRAGYRYCRWCVRSGFVDEGAGVAAGTAMTDRSL